MTRQTKEGMQEKETMKINQTHVKKSYKKLLEVKNIIINIKD